MKTKIETKGLELTPELEKYIARKLARLHRKTPSTLRTPASYDMLLTVATRKSVRYTTCELVVAVGGQMFIAKETTLHVHSAVDVAAVQIEQQLKAHARPRRLKPLWQKLRK